MSASKLRKEIKKQVDELPEGDLQLAKGLLTVLRSRGKDETFEAYMRNRPPLKERLKQAEQDIRAGRLTNWRDVRRDV
ncbi:MAG: hypothetical protein WBD40_19760 [Tepidisphaeraceae bacterium]